MFGRSDVRDTIPHIGGQANGDPYAGLSRMIAHGGLKRVIMMQQTSRHFYSAARPLAPQHPSEPPSQPAGVLIRATIA